MSSPTPIKDRIPFREKVAFSAGISIDYIATTLMMSLLWTPVLNIGYGLSPVALGMILVALRVCDAMSNPIMGSITDNARTRWGRRRPFIFAGAIVSAAVYPLIWYMPSGLGQTGSNTYLTIVGILFFLCFTIWSVPYNALQMELTSNYDERTRLTGWMTLFNKLASLAGGWALALVMILGAVVMNEPGAIDRYGAWIGGILRTAQPWLRAISGAEEGDKAIVVGMRLCAWLIAGSILCLGLLPALFVRERFSAAKALPATKVSVWRNIRDCAGCTPLWVLIAIGFTLVLGISSVGGLGQYLNFYYVNNGDLTRASVIAGWKATVIMISGIAAIPLFTWLGERWDKRTVVAFMLGVSMVGHLANYFCMTPKYPYLQILPGIFEMSALSAVMMFLPSMRADVADYDELHTRRRREGSLNAFFSWFVKLGQATSVGLSGLLMHLSGFEVSLPAQSPETMKRMFSIYLILPIFLWGIGLAATYYYTLNRNRMHEIAAELEARRGHV